MRILFGIMLFFAALAIAAHSGNGTDDSDIIMSDMPLKTTFFEKWNNAEELEANDFGRVQLIMNQYHCPDAL